MIKNRQQIDKIVITGRSHNFCPLGKAHYTNNFTAEFYPNDWIPDYLDVEKYIEETINDKELIIEDCVNCLFNFLNTKYKPKHLIVYSNVKDAKHPEVTVYKELKHD